MLQAPETEADFDRMSWHGCRIWKIEIVAGSVDGQADLVLGLDLVVDALCGFNREAQFKLAPAALTFHAVTDLKIGVDCLGWPRDGEISFGAKGYHQVLLAEPIISETNFLTGAQRRQMLG